MADRTKFEEMLELLVNEDKEGAEALFHEIVVEKSRDIYESLLEDEAEVDESDDDVEEATDEEVDESDDEEVDEATDEEVDESDEEVEEDFDLDEFEVEADPMDDMGGDAGDDMEMDIDMGDEEEGDEEEGDGPEAAMDNLEDALDALKAEFEKMMAGDEGGEDDDEDEPEEEAFAFESDDDEVDEAADEEVDESDEEVDESEEEADESAKSDAETMREYVEKVSGGGLDAQGSAPMGDNGANTKSPVAGKNDMGGTSANIAQGKDNESGDHGGFAGLNAKEEDAGNRNKPGGMSSKKGMKNEPGHGAEKKGKAPESAGADSPINGVSSRAK